MRDGEGDSGRNVRRTEDNDERQRHTGGMTTRHGHPHSPRRKHINLRLAAVGHSLPAWVIYLQLLSTQYRVLPAKTHDQRQLGQSTQTPGIPGTWLRGCVVGSPPAGDRCRALRCSDARGRLVHKGPRYNTDPANTVRITSSELKKFPCFHFPSPSASLVMNTPSGLGSILGTFCLYLSMRCF